MGLDFNCEAHWVYSGFARFRERLAAAAGIPLTEMSGYKEGGIAWSEYEDAIIPLLNHSDCDGELSPEACSAVAPRLREIISVWHYDYDKQQGEMLASGMEKCAACGKALRFY